MKYYRLSIWMSLSLFAMLLSSCGYHLGTSSLSGQYQTFYVPYVKGDVQGYFTQTLINRIAVATPLRYDQDGADLEVKVCLSAPAQRNIGYIYAPNLPNVTTPNEGRLTQTATVTVVDCARRCTVMGPTEITAWLDYDFEPDLGTVNRHAFSLGQLEMNPLARDAAGPALYGLLSEKIVDYVNNSW
ncbi:MAG: hypothetical protein JSS62_05820 [Verrucomicrobia bacterium]|nr:hypothetical protein [Verrucomicrobiota bacterium]MBS0647133.1 hypothetical protein [Verrucomicrobiota bacterium]